MNNLNEFTIESSVQLAQVHVRITQINDMLASDTIDDYVQGMLEIELDILTESLRKARIAARKAELGLYIVKGGVK